MGQLLITLRESFSKSMMKESTLAILLLSLGCFLSIKPALGKPSEDEAEEEGEEGDGDGACPDEWTSVAGGCYKFLPEKLSWEDAIHAEALNQDFPTAWIGLDDTATEGEYLWGSGQAASYTNWAPGQPKNKVNKANPDGEDCAVMNIKDGEGFHKGKPWATPMKWNDVACSVKHHVICQYEKEGFVRAASCEKK